MKNPRQATGFWSCSIYLWGLGQAPTSLGLSVPISNKGRLICDLSLSSKVPESSTLLAWLFTNKNEVLGGMEDRAMRLLTVGFLHLCRILPLPFPRGRVA